MTSIHLRLCNTDSEFIEKAANKVVDEKGGEWYHVIMYFKKIDNGLFVEYPLADMPKEIKQQFEKPEKVY